MDNILIATSGTREEHFEKIRIILQKPKDNDLFLKPEKCQFAQQSVEYLGMIIGTEGVKMDSVKVQGLIDWPITTTVTEVRSFLSFGNFYKPFIADCAQIAQPLHDLTKKNVPFIWSTNQQNAFDELKNQFASQPVLQPVNYESPFTLQTDTSAFAIGATLSQTQEDRMEHPVAFFSCSLQPAEINYDIFHQELLAIVKALRHWHHHLLGARHPI